MPMTAAGVQFCCFLPHLMHSSLVTSVCNWLYVMSSGILGIFVLPPFPIICSAMSHWLVILLYYGRTTCFVLHKYYCSLPWYMFDLPRGRAVHRRRICHSCDISYKRSADSHIYAQTFGFTYYAQTHKASHSSPTPSTPCPLLTKCDFEQSSPKSISFFAAKSHTKLSFSSLHTSHYLASSILLRNYIS